MKILLIDDNTEITDMLSQFLTLSGHNCTSCYNGKDGLKLIKKADFDRVLLDLAMPDFTGYDVINDLEKNGGLVEKRIIVFTASDISQGSIKKLREKGIKCIKKPVQLKDLLQHLKN